MQLVKRSYAGFMHAIASLAPLEKLTAEARDSDAYGWRRWAASLLAIHDIERMIDLGLPWWNVAATREIEAYLRAHPNARVFEYGAGASTAWLAHRAGSVVSVEHHAEWHRLLMTKVGGLGNTRLLHREFDNDAYVGAIAEAEGSFDLIVIDGRLRTDCLDRALPHLKRGGIVLFDDSGRRRYRKAIEDCGLTETRHYGRSYCVPYPDHTSLLHD
ncbi:MAG TPA: class I SAM-dependent methyltransferase [Sphingopyxis sp.]|uniref:class I SAM-dependent methyltransferase n=1 Tax=Sphingopyxis sp. TaxID=1908224 RepID=UPI002C3DD410|nr:class I SAM-dependent methyltransferase [Sphingopyxis sp.]HWW59175.1 class I SAM-dependent methyltransferase [Sphingopyxis sp.]